MGYSSNTSRVRKPWTYWYIMQVGWYGSCREVRFSVCNLSLAKIYVKDRVHLERQAFTRQNPLSFDEIPGPYRKYCFVYMWVSNIYHLAMYSLLFLALLDQSANKTVYQLSLIYTWEPDNSILQFCHAAFYLDVWNTILFVIPVQRLSSVS